MVCSYALAAAMLAMCGIPESAMVVFRAVVMSNALLPIVQLPCYNYAAMVMGCDFSII